VVFYKQLVDVGCSSLLKLSMVCRQIFCEEIEGTSCVWDQSQYERTIYTSSDLLEYENPTSSVTLLIFSWWRRYCGNSQQTRLYRLSTDAHLRDQSYIFIVWEPPYSVWLELDSNSNRLCFLIVIPTCYNRVSYPSVRIQLLAGLGTSWWALLFSVPRLGKNLGMVRNYSISCVICHA
jgi:hypothetical protein